MSLKARIEAVIYAAEEPVTLAQLASLFRDEALVSRAERIAPQADPERPADDLLAEAADAEAPAYAAGSPAPEAPPTESLDADVAPIPSAKEEPTAVAADPVSELAVSDATGSFPDVPPDAATGEGLPSEAPGAEGGAGDEKKAARTRDREARDEIRRLVDELIADYASSDRGLEIREVAGGFRMATRAEYHDAVRAFVKSLKPPMKLSLQALETLAVIAYKQPVTAPEIGEIRGVDSAGVLGSLVSRKLITTAGRKQVIGRPILYKTTKEFLLRFGLKDLNELPSIEEFEKMATELAESEEDAAAIAPSEKELPFAQNEIAELEDAPGGDGEGDPPSAPEPMQDPRPDVPEPPIGEPPPEEDPASGPSGGDPPPPPYERQS
ncbi:MAG TPA: SMC-Scp complex subunit ScpB [Acidobacteriaceae bacterium]